MRGPTLILASASASRAALLAAAGVSFEMSPAGVDEEAVRASMEAEGFGPDDTADALAELKACRESARREDTLVLGADQILVCEGRILEKPGSSDAARTQLQALRGKEHMLISAAVLARNSAPIWRCLETAVLRMRPFTDAFLESYLQEEGEAVQQSVGAYRLEALGAQLFEAVSGDYFTILGLPLLPLLRQLRELNVLEH